MVLSILTPTRNRLSHLTKSLQSLKDKADDPSRLEFILKLDFDDKSDYKNASLPLHKTVYSGRGRGYNDSHRFFNEMAGISNGDILIVWGDDMEMLTQGWDSYLVNFPYPKHGIFMPRFVMVLGDLGAKGIYPLGISRKVYEMTGAVSQHPHVDGYCNEMLRDVYPIDFPIEVYHHRHDLTKREDLNDEVYKNGPIFLSLPKELEGGTGQQWEVERNTFTQMFKEYIKTFEVA